MRTTVWDKCPSATISCRKLDKAKTLLADGTRFMPDGVVGLFVLVLCRELRGVGVVTADEQDKERSKGQGRRRLRDPSNDDAPDEYPGRKAQRDRFMALIHKLLLLFLLLLLLVLWLFGLL